MPIRKTPLATDHYYHLFNRSIAKVPIFTCRYDYRRMFNLISYYRFKDLLLPFSELIKKSKETQTEIIKKLRVFNKTTIEINCYCLMPNHFHFILKQLEESGIKKFISNIQNGYAKYFNLKYKRTGSLFQHPFKAVLIEDDAQLLHLSRYIHLNPYSSYIVKNKTAILQYPWSSLKEFIDVKKELCSSEIIMGQFKTGEEYLKFLLDRADYQRRLLEIKHLTSE